MFRGLRFFYLYLGIFVTNHKTILSIVGKMVSAVTVNWAPWPFAERLYLNKAIHILLLSLRFYLD